MELSEEDYAEIGRLITSGVLGGRLDGEDYCIAWGLTTNKWSNVDEEDTDELEREKEQ
jgi:hypothetical protein